MAKTTERSEPDFAAFIGIDWADQRHTWALQTKIQAPPEPGDLDHTPEAVDAWATELGRRFGGRPIAIALEQSRGSLLFMLTKYAHFVLYPIHPATLANYRKGFRPSGAKSDPSDAGLLLDLLDLTGRSCGVWNPIRRKHAHCSSWWKGGGNLSMIKRATRTV
jgi:hypothetical protein